MTTGEEEEEGMEGEAKAILMDASPLSTPLIDPSLAANATRLACLLVLYFPRAGYHKRLVASFSGGCDDEIPTNTTCYPWARP